MQRNEISAECLDCRELIPYSPRLSACPNCGSEWLQARYDYQAIGKKLQELVKDRPFDLWRYRELLPVESFNPILFMGEGGTPLIHAANLGMMLGCPNLFIKDERQGPTSSFKDRQASVNIAVLKETGVTEMVLSSTGNVAIAYSAYAARAGIKLWAFLTSLVPTEKMRETAIYGTEVIKVTDSYDQTKKIAAQFANQRGLYLERGARSIPSVEAMKTIAFEICEQLTSISQTDYPSTVLDQKKSRSGSTWHAPDWYFQSVSGGLGPLGVQKGFEELYRMGLTDHIPAIAGIQSSGCAPMVRAWQDGKEQAEPIESPRTRIATLSTGDPGRTYTLLRERMIAGGGGTFESVSDEDTFRTMHILAKMEGISVEPAAAVAFGGLIKMVRAGEIDPNAVIVVNCTGHTMPIEVEILGEGWGREVALPDMQAGSGAHFKTELTGDSEQEGLLAALSRVSDDRFSRVLVADDTEEARRLIRRILQSQGSFTITEAIDGWQAVEHANQDPPDLIILDLMMPELDGFGVLDKLKANPRTADIPVIVVTAKELTPEEKLRLGGRIEALMQKGEFLSEELLEEVQSLVR